MSTILIFVLGYGDMPFLLDFKRYQVRCQFAKADQEDGGFAALQVFLSLLRGKQLESGDARTVGRSRLVVLIP
ncbi:hypothetical protein ABZP36_022094 [Zizania latifolia]